jgi:hypothetical protein
MFHLDGSSSDEEPNSSWVNMKSLKQVTDISSVYRKSAQTTLVPLEQKANPNIHSSPSFQVVHKRYHSFVDEFINPDDTLEDSHLLRSYRKLAALMQHRVITLERTLELTRRQLTEQTKRYRLKLQQQQERHERRLTHTQQMLTHKDDANISGLTERPHDGLAKIRNDFEARLVEGLKKNERALEERDRTIADLEVRLKRLEEDRSGSGESKKEGSKKSEESVHSVEGELRDILGQIK